MFAGADGCGRSTDATLVSPIGYSHDQTGVDPFQGSFDAWYQDHPEFLLPSALGLLLTDSIPSRVVTYFLCGTFLFVASYTLARTIGFKRPIAVLGVFFPASVRLAGYCAQ
jgi:hypothetical protein